jgi:hypothetical protein
MGGIVRFNPGPAFKFPPDGFPHFVKPVCEIPLIPPPPPAAP